MPDHTEVKSAAQRIEDAMREVGTLLIAFAPLDAALSERREHVAVFLLLFLGLGALLFVGALGLEGDVVMSSSAYLAFAGVALLGLIGFLFAWFAAPTKAPRPAERAESSGCWVSEPPNKRLKLTWPASKGVVCLSAGQPVTEGGALAPAGARPRSLSAIR